MRGGLRGTQGKSVKKVWRGSSYLKKPFQIAISQKSQKVSTKTQREKKLRGKKELKESYGGVERGHMGGG